VMDWDEVVTKADVESLVLSRMPKSTAQGTLRRVLARTISEVAHGDSTLALYLSERSPTEIALPRIAIETWYRDCVEKYSISLPREIWSEGIAQIHPAFVVSESDAQARVRNWVWRAQASVLLPWVDVHRHEHLKAISHLLSEQAGYGEPIPVSELEVGNIHFQLSGRGGSSRYRELFNRLKSVRNRMAHRDPIGYTELSTVISYVEGFQ